MRDSYDQGRRAYEAKLILVRPDRYIAWLSDRLPIDKAMGAAAILSKSVGRGA